MALDTQAWLSRPPMPPKHAQVYLHELARVCREQSQLIEALSCFIFGFLESTHTKVGNP